MTKLTRAEAETAGYVVDSHCYPWLGYKGPRFAPTGSVVVLTDLEADLLSGLERVHAANERADLWEPPFVAELIGKARGA